MKHEPDRRGTPSLRDLRGLVEFAAVARWEHVTRAAEELGIPQPTLSRRIAHLEQTVAVPLFTRRGRRLELTRAGRQLAVVADRALVDLARGLAEVTRSVDPHTGTVGLVFLNTLGAAVVPRILRDFRSTQPGIAFELVQEGHDAALARLRSGDVDVCLTSPMPKEPGLEALALHRQPLLLTVPEGHRLARAARVRLDDAASEQFVGFKRGYGMRRITEEWCHRAGFVPRLAFEGEDVATVRGLVAAGLGVALLPSAGSPATGSVELPIHDLQVVRTISLVTASARDLPPPARLFHEFLVERGARLVAAAIDETPH
jgi:LysR family transcriptional regulator, transcription activator of glutamate synthase operon